MYIEKNGHDVILHTTSNVFVERTSLNEISKRLPVFFLFELTNLILLISIKFYL